MNNEDEIIEKVECVTIDVKTNKGNRKIIFTKMESPIMENFCDTQRTISDGTILEHTSNKYKKIIFNNALMSVIAVD